MTSREEFWTNWTSRAEDTGDYLMFMLGEKDSKTAMRVNDSDIKELFGDILPDLSGLEVLELASGSGRLTGELARRSKHVTSTDFMQGLVDENKRVNGPLYDNITFCLLDATELDYPANSFDVVFFTFLLVYLSNVEVEELAQKIIKILRPGGYLFFRESHYTCICSRSAEGNPGIYRSLQEYHGFFWNCFYITDATSDQSYTFSPIRCTNNKTYVKKRKIPTVFDYLWRKQATRDNNRTVFQKQLDETVYSDEHVKLYKQVIGGSFTTPGGLKAIKEVLAKLSFSPQFSCLDIGCGFGGALAYLIKEFGVHVTGVELSVACCQEATILLQNLKTNQGYLSLSDISSMDFKMQSFDVILLLETLEYFTDMYKENLLFKMSKWLKETGSILLSTYCYTRNNTGDEVVGVSSFFLEENLHIVTVTELIQMVKRHYSSVTVEDLSENRINFIDEELGRIKEITGIPMRIKKTFVKKWETQLQALKNKEIKYIVVVARQ